VATLHNQELIEASEKSTAFAVNLANFEGPFDLLLSLISKHQVDITEVSLSKVTDEFIAYLKLLDDAEEMDQASEFLVIAATLLDLKIAGLICAGFIVGGLLGAKIATSLSNIVLERIFGTLLLAIGLKMIFFPK
jgi:segregation and condensation protein A